MPRNRPNFQGLNDSIETTSKLADLGDYKSIYNRRDIKKYKIPEGPTEMVLFPFNLKEPTLIVGHREQDIDWAKYKGNFWAHTTIVYYHSNVGPNDRDNFICLNKTIGARCPLCEARLKMQKEEGVEYSDLPSEVKYITKALYNALIISEKEKGLQLVEAPYVSVEKVLPGRARNRRTGAIEKDYCNPYSKWNVYFEREGTTVTTTKYKEVDIIEREPGTLTDSEIDKLMEQVIIWDDVLYIPTYEEVLKAKEGILVVDHAEETSAKEVLDDQNDVRVDVEKPKEEFPPCFAKEYERIDDCEICPQSIYDQCREMYNKEVGRR